MQEKTSERNYNFLSSFILKVIAILTMTIDHIGVVMEMYSIAFEVSTVFRIIGRMALPLFCFMVCEGVIHTKSFGKYILRMGIIGTLVLIAQILMEYASEPLLGYKIAMYQGGIFFDLILGASAVKALMDKRMWIKLLSIIPLGIGILSFICFGYEAMGGMVYAFPYYLRTQYGILGILLIIIFYLAYKLAPIFMKMFNMDPLLFKGTNTERIAINVTAASLFLVVGILYYLLGFSIDNMNIHHFGVFWDVSQQNYMLLSIVFILLYSGKRGYNSKWFKYGQYLYYPLHILLIYAIFTLIMEV